MSGFRDILHVLVGDDVKIRRQVAYWAATVVLYFLCVALLWMEVWAGGAAIQPAVQLTACIVGGIAFFYALIRASRQLHILPSQLAVYQGNFAIICSVAAYAIAPQIRGAALIILVVVLVFCAFTLTPEKSRRMSIFAIVLLGITMVSMINIDPEQFRPRLELAHFLMAATMLVMVAYLTGELSKLRVRLKTQKDELADALSRIQTLATRDELTSLANRRYMCEILAQEERRHKAQGHPVCVAVIDIDLFKQINDIYGHAVGDEVLRMFAQQVQLALRTDDVVARWGGEEFLLLFPNTDQYAARLVLERLKEQIAALDLSGIAPGRRISFSCGLIALDPTESVSEAVSRADHAMYRAKSAGRDCIVAG